MLIGRYYLILILYYPLRVIARKIPSLNTNKLIQSSHFWILKIVLSSLFRPSIVSSYTLFHCIQNENRYRIYQYTTAILLNFIPLLRSY